MRRSNALRGSHMYGQALYKRSVEMKRSASGLFNLGVTHYHLSAFFCLRKGHTSVLTAPSEEFDEAITAWKESITLQPSSPDAHTSAFHSLPIANPPHSPCQTWPVHTSFRP